MKKYYCWKCKKDMPFLEEDEWKQVGPLLSDARRAIKEFREEQNCDLQEALRKCRPKATLKFEELTGLSGIHFHIIQHHRLKDWGEECPDCGHLLRTPKAKFCANCGRRKEQVPNSAF